MPTVEGLTVRVINNVKKRTEVKPRFAEAFQHENIASEYPYTQKVLPICYPLYCLCAMW